MIYQTSHAFHFPLIQLLLTASVTAVFCFLKSDISMQALTYRNPVAAQSSNSIKEGDCLFFVTNSSNKYINYFVKYCFTCDFRLKIHGLKELYRKGSA